jgi:hypothetical protein
VATGCLAKLSGEIYSLNAYKSGPAKKCRTGDQIIRVQLHQPTTSIAKRAATIGPGGGKTMLTIGEDLLVSGGFTSTTADEGRCLLVVHELESDYENIIANVPKGEVQQGIREVVRVDLLSEGSGFETETYETERLVWTQSGDFMFHDVLVDNRGDSCFVAFVLEHAPSLAAFYDK